MHRHVDYQMLIRDPVGTAAALSAAIPCLGELDASRKPERGFNNDGRGDSILEFSRSHPQSEKAMLRSIPCSSRAVLEELGYILPPNGTACEKERPLIPRSVR